MDDLINAIDKEKENRFQKPWPKLDKGSKLNRILIFIKMEKTNRGLNDSQEKQLKILLYQLCETNAINKITDVNYSEESNQIETIHNLVFNEENKKYSYNYPEKKTKASTKSKTNVERHFNRSKTNKN